MFTPKPLSAAYGDYSPAISAEIMELHYSKHYQGYINNLNLALQKYPHYFDLEVSEILSKINEVPEEIRTAVRNNGGGVINHEIFWETLSTKPTEIHTGPLKETITTVFGSWEAFIDRFKESCLKLFGSGWVWLVQDKASRELKLMSCSNQDSPFMFDCVPIVGIDVWEHAYYPQYKNVRKEYIENIFQIINWKFVEDRLLSFC